MNQLQVRQSLTRLLARAKVATASPKDGYTVSDTVDLGDKPDGSDAMSRMDVHESGKNVAYLAYRDKSTEGDGPWISGLYVDPSHRRTGLAKLLLQRLEQQRHAGEAIRLRARPYKDAPISQQDLQRFYASLGYVAVDDEGRMMKKVASTDAERRRQAVIDKFAGIRSFAMRKGPGLGVKLPRSQGVTPNLRGSKASPVTAGSRLLGEFGPRPLRKSGPQLSSNWINEGKDSYGLLLKNRGVGRASATLSFDGDKSQLYLDMFSRARLARPGAGKTLLRNVVESTRQYSPETISGHFTSPAALGSFGSVFGKENVTFQARMGNATQNIAFDDAIQDPSRYIASVRLT